MPAKVVEPNGNQLNDSPKNCGYLERADIPLDAQGALVRIPFINEDNLEYGDLVVYKPIKNCNIEINGEKGKITMAKIIENPNTNAAWQNAEFKNKWKDWDKVPDEIIKKLKLKEGVTAHDIAYVTNVEEYKQIKQKK